MRVRRFLLKTPKGLLTLVLAVLVTMAAPDEHWRLVAPGLFASVCCAGLIDAVILRTRSRRWSFPSGAVLTATIVSMVLSAQTPWWIVALASVVGVGAKYIVRTRGANVFNPAALGIVALFPVAHMAQNWWGALPDGALAWQIALAAGAGFIAVRVNKLPPVFSFLLAYFGLFTAPAYTGDPARVSQTLPEHDLTAFPY